MIQNAGNGVSGPSNAVNLDLITPAGKDDPTTFFSDGKRKIDFVMVYEERGASVDEPSDPKVNGTEQPQRR